MLLTSPQHASSRDYKVQEFISDPKCLSEVVQFDVPLLGDITGLNCVHLQCHIGTDTLSLARLGAASVTGLDFSSAALVEARKLAESTAGPGCGDKVSFVEASVYDGLKVLNPGSFDLVFTGIGALCWIPSIKDWAKVVSGLLKPGGRLFIREGHPVLWAIDDKQPEKLIIDYPYFERDVPTMFEEEGTYVESGDYKFQSRQTAEFNHGIGEIVQALLEEGMRITGLVEHQSVPWPAIPDQMKEDERGKCGKP